MKRSPKTSAAPPRKRILIVDDHPLMREGVTQWLKRASDLELCGESESAADVLLLVEKLKPDLVLMDISLEGRSGLELIKDLGVFRPELPVLVLTMHEESLYAWRALRAGARGYIVKRVGGMRVLEAIREVLRGRIAISPEMSTQLLEEYSGQQARSGRNTLPNLTDREFEVFQLIAVAKNNREIAEQLHLSRKTVETHRLNLMRKLKLETPVQLMRFAFQYVESQAARPHQDVAAAQSLLGGIPDQRGFDSRAGK